MGMDPKLFLNITLATLIVTIIVTSILLFFFRKKLFNLGIKGIDQQKKNKPEISTGGGIPVIVSFTIGSIIFALLGISFQMNPVFIVYFFAGVLSILIVSSAGILDDFNMGKNASMQHSDTLEKRIGLKQWQKPLITLFGAIPIILVTLSQSVFEIPFFGFMEVGIFYSILLVPLGVICVSNAANMLAGLNGLESGLISVAAFFLIIISFLKGSFLGTIFASLLFGVSIAYFLVSKYPSSFLPGDSYTYFSGGTIAVTIILGNFVGAGTIIFLPWIIEAFLKLRGKFKVRSFGNLQKDGTIKAPYEKIYSLTHIAMKFPKWIGLKGFKEYEAVNFLLSIEVIIGLITIWFVYVGVL